MTEILNAGPTVNEQELARAEKILGRPLPPLFRTFLLRNNGGYPREGLFSLGKKGGASVVQTFLRIQEGHRDDIRKRAASLADRLPQWLLPIGYDPGGNPICIAAAGPQTGAIFFWDHESEADGQPSDEAAIHVASNLEGFLSSLTGG